MTDVKKRARPKAKRPDCCASFVRMDEATMAGIKVMAARGNRPIVNEIVLAVKHYLRAHGIEKEEVA